MSKTKTKTKPLTEARLLAAVKSAGATDEQLERVSSEYRKQYMPEPTVKVIPLSDGKVTGFAAVFTSAVKMDKHANFFDYGRTNFFLSNYRQIPIFKDHGKGGERERVGMVKGLTTIDGGLRVTSANFDLSKPLGRRCWADALKGRLYWSGGALPDLVDIAEDGCITRFPIAELSVTYSPAGPAYKSDHYTRAQVARDLNDTYSIKARRALLEHGLPAEAVDAIANVLPAPYGE